MTTEDLGPASEVVRALVAPPTESELAGEEAARQSFRTAYGRSGRRRLRVVSGTGMTVAASSALLSMTVVTAAAYTAVLPHDVQRVAHRLLHRLGVPAPHEEIRAAHRVVVPRLDRETPSPQPVTPPAPVLTPHLAVSLVAVGSDAQVSLVTRNLPVGTPAVLLALVPDQKTWTTLATSRVDEHHLAWAVAHHVPSSLELKWVVPARHLVSAVVLLQARPRLDSMTRASTLVVESTPDQRGRQVLVEELVNGRWVQVATVTLDRTGSATYLPSTHRAGVLRLRCVLPGSRRYAGATSAVTTISVR